MNKKKASHPRGFLLYLKLVTETNVPTPFPHVLVGYTFLTNEIVEAEVITRLQTVAIPFQTSADTPLDIRTNQFVIHAVVGLGLNTLCL